jgi:hypothetical protein
MPELKPEAGLASLDSQTDWAAPMGDRGSMISRYSRPVSNRLLYVQNDQDHSHWTDHYLPFRSAVEGVANDDRIEYVIYTGPEGHSAPPKEIFEGAIARAIEWSRSSAPEG